MYFYYLLALKINFWRQFIIFNLNKISIINNFIYNFSIFFLNSNQFPNNKVAPASAKMLVTITSTLNDYYTNNKITFFINLDLNIQFKMRKAGA